MQRVRLTFVALLTLAQACAMAQVSAVPPRMNFQGRLARPDGTPIADGTHSVRFSLWTAVTGGTEKWNQVVNVTVRNGTFAALLDTGTGAADKFKGSLFLEIKIGTNAPLTPRQPLTSVAYAMKADSVKDGSITSASIANGTLTAADFAPNALNLLAWLLGGNASPAPDSFLGTLTNFPLELRVNNRRAMEFRYGEYTATAGQEYRSINVLGGASVNEIEFGVVGATIAGGGKDSFSLADGPNRVTADFGAIGGGYRNSVTNSASVVSGGEDNNANGAYSNIGGGQSNTTDGQYAAVGGGYFNRATGTGATVPGGWRVSASGTTSFAAGYRANASHRGSFVWGDSSEFDLFSTGPDEFLIRAHGGVGINTNLPQSDTLHIKGNGRMLNLEGDDHAYIQFFPQGWANGRAAYIGFPGAFSTELVLANEIPGGVVRVIGNFVNSSDARLKHDVRPLANPLDALLGLRGVSYLWNSDGPEGKRQIGFLAQEVEKVLPELIYTDEKGYKSVAYVSMVPVLVEAMKQQQKQREADQAEVKALKATNTTIKIENVELKARLDAVLERLERLEADRKEK
jgi:hypothetical protein